MAVQTPVLKLARQAAEAFIKSGEMLQPPAWRPQTLMLQRACYVSILENPGRHLRAAAGYPLPRQSELASEIVANTIEAVRGSRSGRIRVVDLPYLSYDVSVLGPLERITTAEHLQPDRYGLYVRSDRNKSAVLLPGRPGINDPEEQIATAIRESDINQRHEAVTMYRFNVTRYADGRS